ncbi:adenosylcobinamide-phosphate synthase CbiB [Rhodoferax sp.]|uniref:adenosylcobinamide-phosphate synthase CbiB n=1 Tax=Rhodoferax sp. TaxID=50421 RepID=UPI0026179B99|nr:adenosylcobinamide-phosphate synthase CbiB [Rhodoferax sp.]MDD3934995.1 adenosylcobinamide-phosphate synthase CbiB [Rhodoferax sp.]
MFDALTLLPGQASAQALAAALLVALLIDHVLGEPPARLHPVVWMGNYLSWAGRRVQRVAWQPSSMETGAAAVPTPKDVKVFWLAAIYWMVGAVGCLLALDALQRLVMQLPAWLAALLLGLLLKPLLAWTMLKSEVRAVDVALGQSLEVGRERLGWLVSRDVSALSEAQVRESAIESLAENLNDSVVAPIFWFVLLGLPGAALYRFANTADAMWGYQGVYKGQNWQWAGKWAARADDVLSWLPARLTALLLVLVSSARWLPVCREAAKTPSPNSGWPMATMALALDIRLGKPGVYVLNPAGRQPTGMDTARALMYAEKVIVILTAMALMALVLRSVVVS